MVMSPENIVGGYIVPLIDISICSFTSSGVDVLVGDPSFEVVEVAGDSLLAFGVDPSSWAAPYADQQHVSVISTKEDAKCRCMVAEHSSQKFLMLMNFVFNEIVELKK